MQWEIAHGRHTEAEKQIKISFPTTDTETQLSIFLKRRDSVVFIFVTLSSISSLTETARR